MAKRVRPKRDRAADVAAKIEQIAKLSPTAGAMFEDWINRLLAGEPIENVQPEMERMLEVFKKHRPR